MRRLIQFCLLLLTAGTTRAHLGNENDTEVRVYADRMQVVVRTSIPFAWTVLGKQAPVVADEQGREVARPRLASAASGLFHLTAGGKPITATKTDCLFEVENDVAFVLVFERPLVWPVVLNATFFPLLSNLDSGTIRVFDFTASPFNSDLKPLAEGVLHQGNPSFTFSLEAPVPVVSSDAIPEPIPVAAGEPARPRSIMTVFILLAGCVLMVLIWTWLRSSRRH
jgi:hypothetical protein